MSLFKINDNKSSPVGQLVDEMKVAVSQNGTEFANQQTTDSVLSMESLSSHDVDTLNQTVNGIQDSLKSAFENIHGVDGLGTESLSISQLEAGAMAAAAGGSPLKYAQAALSGKTKTSDGVQVISAESKGSFGSLDFRDSASMEAFDERNFKDMIPYSIAFNVHAARQDEFSETFYPTSVASPENGGMDVTLDFTTVFNHVKRSASGTPTDFNQTNLLEAIKDHTVLEDESTALVPHRTTSPDNTGMFIDDTLFAPYNRTIAGVDVETAPLAPSKDIDLIGISSHPGLLGSGILDNTDSLDTRVHLRNLVFKNEWDDGAGNTGTDVFKFVVDRLPSNSFIDSLEGPARSMLLNFSNDTLSINKDTKAADGSVPTSTAEIVTNDYTVRLNVSVAGNLNLEFGTVRVIDAGISVKEIIDVDGTTISTTSGVGATIKAKLESMTLAGYELTANRTNTNRRTRGLLLNNRSMTERFAIPLGAPISAPSPIGSDRDTRDLESLITAARIRNSNNAVTTLLNYGSTLKAYVGNRETGIGNLNIEGIARHVVTPFFEEFDLDMASSLNSTASAERAQDVSATLVNVIRDIAYRMYRDSGIQAALDASSVGSKKPTLLIGTDSIIQRHLMVEGDTRTYGMTFENAKTVHTVDQRMKNKIVLTFTRDGNGGTPDALAFGTHAWIPELTSSMSVTRDGSMHQEAMVQPRSRHINNLPVMAIINVTNLSESITSRTLRAPVDA